MSAALQAAQAEVGKVRAANLAEEAAVEMALGQAAGTEHHLGPPATPTAAVAAAAAARLQEAEAVEVVAVEAAAAVRLQGAAAAEAAAAVRLQEAAARLQEAAAVEVVAVEAAAAVRLQEAAAAQMEQLEDLTVLEEGHRDLEGAPIVPSSYLVVEVEQSSAVGGRDGVVFCLDIATFGI